MVCKKDHERMKPTKVILSQTGNAKLNFARIVRQPPMTKDGRSDKTEGIFCLWGI